VAVPPLPRPASIEPAVPGMKWTAREIARALAVQAFDQRHLVVCPNTYWPGSETDVLIVRTDLRLMDVEIKVSRADLKADRLKEKWFDFPISWPWNTPRPEGAPRTHPRRIWKHYYCLPRAIWTEELAECIQPTSGVILMSDHNTFPGCVLHRQAKPAKDAERISPQELADIARVQSKRMWDAFDEVDRTRRRVREEAA
jgi:hypothetical protein